MVTVLKKTLGRAVALQQQSRTDAWASLSGTVSPPAIFTNDVPVLRPGCNDQGRRHRWALDRAVEASLGGLTVVSRTLRNQL
jgi:hypothetical protein